MNVGSSGLAALTPNVAQIQSLAAQRSNSDKADEANGKSEASVREIVAERGKLNRSIRVQSLEEAVSDNKVSKTSEVNDIVASNLEKSRQQKNDSGFNAAAIGRNANVNKQQLGVRVDISV